MSSSPSRMKVGSSDSPEHGVVVPRANISSLKLPFPWKLHQLLDDAAACVGSDHDEYSSIVSWIPGGHAFQIHKPKVFEKDVMPTYFRQSKLSSFVRQLYMYGFTKIEDGEYRGAYFHPEFTQDNKSATMTLTRNRHNDRRLKNNYPDKESIAASLAPSTKRCVSTSSSDGLKGSEGLPTPINASDMADRPATEKVDPTKIYSIGVPHDGAERVDLQNVLLRQITAEPASIAMKTEGAPAQAHHDLPYLHLPSYLGNHSDEPLGSTHRHGLLRGEDNAWNSSCGVSTSADTGDIPCWEQQQPSSAARGMNEEAGPFPPAFWNDFNTADTPNEQNNSGGSLLRIEPTSTKDMQADIMRGDQGAAVQEDQTDDVCDSLGKPDPDAAWGCSFYSLDNHWE